MKLLTFRNAKTIKGEKHGYKTYVLYLSPADVSGFEVCPFRSKGCTAACLNTAGMGVFDNVQEARKRKTRLFFENKPEFLHFLVQDIEKASVQAKKQGMIPVFRLNGTSDITWESIPVWRNGKEYSNVFLAFPELQFYDYTKYPFEKRDTCIPNYHLTFSRAENKASHQREKVWLEQGFNATVVFRRELPAMFEGKNVVSGDDTDLRFKDKKGVVVGLRAKGKARKDASGFVVD